MKVAWHIILRHATFVFMYNYLLLSDKTFQTINNLLIYIELSDNFDKEACL